jgi:hypothetical protein
MQSDRRSGEHQLHLSPQCPTLLGKTVDRITAQCGTHYEEVKPDSHTH